MILLGDPAQLPAIGHRDIFGTQLWRTFSILILREVKHATDPILSSVLLKVRMGVCWLLVILVVTFICASLPLNSVHGHHTYLCISSLF